jgi:DNA mismatch repair protein MSH5
MEFHGRLQHGNSPHRSRELSATPLANANDRCETENEESPTNRDTEPLDEVVMAVDVRGSLIIGCSYYVAREETMYFMEDCKLADTSLVDACKSFVLLMILKKLTL